MNPKPKYVQAHPHHRRERTSPGAMFLPVEMGGCPKFKYGEIVHIPNGIQVWRYLKNRVWAGEGIFSFGIFPETTRTKYMPMPTFTCVPTLTCAWTLLLDSPQACELAVGLGSCKGALAQIWDPTWFQTRETYANVYGPQAASFFPCFFSRCWVCWVQWIEWITTWETLNNDEVGQVPLKWTGHPGEGPSLPRIPRHLVANSQPGWGY